MILTVPCLFGLESLVADEMKRLQLKNVRAENGRVHCEGDMADISSRCTNLALSLGINMATVMKECSRSVGGNGGGHANAAGGRIPADRIDEFVHLADRMIFEQKRL